MDEDILASLHDYREFLESNVWKDLKSVLEERIEAYRDELERAPVENVVPIQSGIEELRFFVSLPEETMKRLEQNKEEMNDG